MNSKSLESVESVALETRLLIWACSIGDPVYPKTGSSVHRKKINVYEK